MNPVDVKFKECCTCRAKTGTPVLCNACLHNRQVIQILKTCTEMPDDFEEMDSMLCDWCGHPENRHSCEGCRNNAGAILILKNVWKRMEKISWRKLEDLTEPPLRDLMSDAAKSVVSVLQSHKIEGPPKFALVIFNDPMVGQYISSCEPVDMVKAMRETADRIENNQAVGR